jgi:hypothetical protein
MVGPVPLWVFTLPRCTANVFRWNSLPSSSPLNMPNCEPLALHSPHDECSLFLLRHHHGREESNGWTTTTAVIADVLPPSRPPRSKESQHGQRTAALGPHHRPDPHSSTQEAWIQRHAMHCGRKWRRAWWMRQNPDIFFAAQHELLHPKRRECNGVERRANLP